MREGGGVEQEMGEREGEEEGDFGGVKFRLRRRGVRWRGVGWVSEVDRAG